MISVSISIDVPNLADAVRFYASAFGFSKSAEPVPGVVVLTAGMPLLPRLCDSSTV